jgi:hypothetical protein
MKNLSAIVLIFALAGCLPLMIWVKPGATQQDYSQDKYHCLKEAQQRSAYAQYNGNPSYQGASLSDQMVTNPTLFNACMNAQGWYQQAQ